MLTQCVNSVSSNERREKNGIIEIERLKEGKVSHPPDLPVRTQASQITCLSDTMCSGVV